MSTKRWRRRGARGPASREDWKYSGTSTASRGHRSSSRTPMPTVCRSRHRRGWTPRADERHGRLAKASRGAWSRPDGPWSFPGSAKSPSFLHRTGRRRKENAETTFICVPIPGQRRPIGAMNVDLPFEQDRDYQRDLQLFQVVATMFAQAFRVKQLVEAGRQRLLAENTHLKAELKERYDFSNLIGTSGPMRQVYEQIARVASTNTTVLIRGESGTGKELIAHAIHYNSPRAKNPFIKVSCAALPDSLVESELFGYERGAFTGATERKKGRFELAERGTLFLDEIGDINLSTQVKLLRVLQERGVRAPWRRRINKVQRPDDCRHQRRPGEGDRRQDVPRRLPLPAQRLHDLRPALARAQDGHPSTG